MFGMKNINGLIPNGCDGVAVAGSIIFLVIDRYFC